MFKENFSCPFLDFDEQMLSNSCSFSFSYLCSVFFSHLCLSVCQSSGSWSFCHNFFVDTMEKFIFVHQISLRFFDLHIVLFLAYLLYSFQMDQFCYSRSGSNHLIWIKFFWLECQKLQSLIFLISDSWIFNFVYFFSLDWMEKWLGRFRFLFFIAVNT